MIEAREDELDEAEDELEGALKRFWRGVSRLPTLVTGHRPIQDACVYFPGNVINRPDPCIYDQTLLMALGLPVTWENPDCAITVGGVPQNSYDLLPNKKYDVTLTVHNSSKEKAAPGTRVDIRWMEFGIGGATRHAITSRKVNVPTWPGTVSTTVAWTTPPAEGHYCLEFELSHPQDGNPANNLGQHNTVVKAARSTVELAIPVHNIHHAHRVPRSGAKMATTSTADDGHGRLSARHVDLVVDSYAFVDRSGDDVDVHDMFRAREAMWNARVEPSHFEFEVGESMREARLIVDAPNGSGAPEVFNVTGWQGGVPMGGVTVTVTRS